MCFREYLYSASLSALLVLVLSSNLQAKVDGFKVTKLIPHQTSDTFAFYTVHGQMAVSDGAVVLSSDQIADIKYHNHIITVFEKGPDGRYKEIIIKPPSMAGIRGRGRVQSLAFSEGVIAFVYWPRLSAHLQSYDAIPAKVDKMKIYVYEKGPDGSYKGKELILPSDNVSGFKIAPYKVAVSNGVIAVASVSDKQITFRDFTNGPNYIHIFEKDRDGTYQEKAKFEHFSQYKGFPPLLTDQAISISASKGVIALSARVRRIDDEKVIHGVYAYEKDRNGRYKETKLVVAERSQNNFKEWYWWQEKSDSFIPSGHAFGRSIAVSNGVIVVGHPSSDGPGATYVFTKDLNGTYQETKLMASDGVIGNNFGASVSVSEEMIVVGASGDNEMGVESGAVYVYKKDRNGTYQETKLMDPDGGKKDRFGHIVSVSEGVIAASSRDRRNWGDERCSNAIYLFEPEYKKIGFSTKELQESLVELSDTTPKAYSEFYKALSSKVDELPLKVGRSAANTNYKARAYLLMAIEPLVTGFDSDYFKEKVHASYKESLKELTEELGIESKEDLRSSSKIVGIRLDLSIEALKALKRSVNNEQAQELNEFLSELGHLKASLNADPRSYNKMSEELSGVIESYENLLLEMATIWRNLNFVQLVQSVK